MQRTPERAPLNRHAEARPAAAPVSPTGRRSFVPAPARKAPLARRAALLRPGPGVHPPILLAMPRILHPTLAQRRRTDGSRVAIVDRRRGIVSRIRLAVLVDESGYVTTAQVAGGDTSQMGFDRAALNAALATRFRPATRYGVPGKMWTRLTFDFQQ
ncbi:MAG: energy transducer TonB [Acidobacteria bacterium]|nr:energy transducer TonB [Acidobacteriota bacterium]